MTRASPAHMHIAYDAREGEDAHAYS